MYVESSLPRQENDRAKLSFSHAGSGQFCLTFYYHMHGGSAGELNVYSENQLIFRKSGKQGDFWRKADVSLIATGMVSVSQLRLPTTGDSVDKRRTLVREIEKSHVGWTNTQGLEITEEKVLPF